ncbi:GNAT family N-acetyltransferase [Muricauda sp. MAR_2010_75]|uniref:GNAT family N-acetyltransferase n=1 Tax=Allomuricauda sp. MAR_2010_75 TaxID=1250232 RepID=UPI00056A8246|nr:GNAT family N-acetyltransferase [Muricauda sp. MAR_2010_75]
MNLNDTHIRTNIKPGDLGFVMYRHGKLYGEEYNYGVSFETYVGAGLHEFYENYNPDLDRAWICEYEEKIVGFLLLMHRKNHTAQLRYFYLEHEFRGIGLGKKLMSLFMDFLQEKKYRSCYLWTTHELLSAASLYKRHGFILTKEKETTSFGKLIKEQRYDLSKI